MASAMLWIATIIFTLFGWAFWELAGEAPKDKRGGMRLAGFAMTALAIACARAA